MQRPLFQFLLLVMLAAFAAAATAQDSGSGEEIESSKTAELVDQIIGGLGSSRFSDRQKAALEFLKLDASAVPLVEDRAKTASPAAASQLQILIPKLRKQLFDDRLDALIRNPDTELATGMPEWNRFQQLAGASADSLSVYLQLLQAERDLFAASYFSSPDFAERLEKRSAALVAACDGLTDEDFPIACCAGLMLLGSNVDHNLKGATSTNITAALVEPRFEHLMEDGVHSEILKAIASAWIERPGIAVDRPLLFAIKHRLPAGRNVALQTIAKSTQNQSTTYALLCLGVFEHQDDLPAVERLLIATRTVWPQRNQTVRQLLPGREVDSTFSVQARDVALAVAIHLRGARPQEFGIPVVSSDLHLFMIGSMGFNSDADRDVAIAKYRSRFPDSQVPPDR